MAINRILSCLDDDGNEVPKEKATRINIADYDENGNRIREEYMATGKRLTEEEADEYWSQYIDNSSKPENKKREYTEEEILEFFSDSVIKR